MPRPYTPLAVLLIALGISVPAADPVRPDPPAVVLRVDQHHPDASDRNPGTVARPLRTVTEAVRRAVSSRRRGLGARVTIAAGVYRERLVLEDVPSAPHATIVLEGDDIDSVVLSGADRWTRWVRSPGTDLYRHSRADPTGPVDLPEGWESVRDEVGEVVRRGEAVFVDGRLFRQVVSRAELEAAPRRFLVDERDAPGAIWIHMPPGLTPRSASIEVAARPIVIDARGVDDLVLRGFTVRHAASRLQDPAVRIDRASDVTLERLRIEWNSWNGLGLFGVRDVVVRDVTANHNGAGGLNVFGGDGLRIERMDASFNNWRGAWGGFLGWATGQKLFHVHDARLTDFRAIANQATGLWFDTDAADVVLDRARLADNATRGLFVEAVQGPILVRDSVISGNGEVGIFATSAARVTLERNTIVDNGDHEIWLPWMAEHHVVRSVTDGRSERTIDIRSSHWTLRDNTVGSSAAGLLLGVGTWQPFLRTLQSAGNRWYRAAGEDGFGVYDGLHAPVGAMPLVDWQRLSGQDLDSTFAATAPPAVPEPGASSSRAKPSHATSPLGSPPPR